MDTRKGRIVIIDYQMGNLFSVKRACEHVGLSPLISSDASAILTADAVILPGVGAFGDAMANLINLDLVSPVRDFIASGRPFMGICLGQQLLMTQSEEFGRHRGLDIIRGTVVKFPTSLGDGPAIKVPQVGWNRIYPPEQSAAAPWETTLLRGISTNTFMYFVHSYYILPDDASVALSFTNYEGIEYVSSVLSKNVFACQFHPEKSSSEGMRIYENFARVVNAREEGI